jgi:hypothetical protein
MSGLRTLRTFAFVLIAFCVISTASAANVVQNPGFETGDFTSWTVNTASNHPWSVDGGGAFAGTYYASTGCVGAQCITGTATQQASLSQTLATTAGQTYTLTFEFSTQGNNIANELDVLWNGTSVLDLGPGGTLGVIPSYTLYTVSNLSATSSSSTLTFLGRQDPGYDALDNVDVELSGTGGVPEPSTWLLMGGALLPLLRAARRRTLASR